VDALERLRYQPVDLVVSDVQMPRMNGIELTRQVKSQWAQPVAR
jgi:CheY-like chemotaxis protein